MNIDLFCILPFVRLKTYYHFGMLLVPLKGDHGLTNKLYSKQFIDIFYWKKQK